MTLSRRLQELMRRLREARNMRASAKDTTEAILRLSKEKQLAIIGLMSVYINVDSKSDEEDVARNVATFIPDLATGGATHWLATDTAYTRIIMHLVHELAAARRQDVHQTWQQVAVELARQASDA